jgi:hypothetical protein
LPKNNSLNKFFFCLIAAVLSFTSAFSQNVKVTQIDIDKRIFCSRIAWRDENKFCLINDKFDTQGSRYVHFISVYSKDGQPLHLNEKIATEYSLNSDYTLVLGKKIMFFGDKISEMDDHIFNLYTTVDETGQSKESPLQIFSIWQGKEGQKLNAQRYSFKIFRGQNKSKALLTYNNDYKDPYPEGFLFRTIDENCTLSPVDTFNLPYPDRQCNINDVLYDDAENKIYFTCDLFHIVNKKERAFNRSFVSVYDINTKSYVEISKGVPSFYESKIQHTETGDSIVYAILHPKETPNGWTSSFLTIKKSPFQLSGLQHDNLPEEATRIFFSKKNKVNLKYVLPYRLYAGIDGSYNAAWNNYFLLDQISDANSSDNGAIVMSAFMFGMMGAIIATAATDGDDPRREVSGQILWLKSNPGANHFQNVEKCYSLLADNYSHFSYGTFVYNDEILSLCNRLNGVKNKNVSVCIENLNNNNSELPRVLSEEFKKYNINVIQPQSFFEENGKVFFIGEYNPKYDWNTPHLFDEKKYVLVEIE